MKKQKVRDLDDREMKTQLRDTEEQLFRLRFQMSMGQMEGLKKLRGMKKNRARMLTILPELCRYPCFPVNSRSRQNPSTSARDFSSSHAAS